MFKSKLKEIGSKILEQGLSLFEGTGVGSIPTILRLFAYLSHMFDLRMTKEIRGYKFNVRASPQSLLYFSRRFEPHVRNLYCSLLKEGMIVADVGASTGYYTLLASKIVGSTGSVLSFEPEPHRFRELVDNVRINKCNNVKPFKLAVSDKEGETEFEQVNALGSGCVVKAKKNAKKRTRVKTTTLDSFKIGVDLVKIDVEGAELEVLKGMKKILAKGKVKIICEVHPKKPSSLGYSTKEIEDLLRQYNYDVYLIGEKGLIPTSYLANERGHYLFTGEKWNEICSRF